MLDTSALTADQLAAIDADAKARYVDPAPGRKGTDKIAKPCGYCGGTGIYSLPSSWHWMRWAIRNGRLVPLGDRNWCFYCHGVGYRRVLVSGQRAAARKQARLDAQAPYLAAQRAAAIDAANAARFLADWDDAIAMNARFDAQPKGFLGNPGDKIKNLDATVTVSTSFDTAHPRGYGTITKKVLVFATDDGKLLKTIGTGASLWGNPVGTRVTILGATITGHSNWHGADQTVANRVRLAD